MALLSPTTHPLLPVLFLQNHILLLPGSRISIPVSKDQARSIISLVQENAEQGTPTANLLGAVPLLPPPSHSKSSHKANDIGTVARITRLVRPSPLQPSQSFTLTLEGLKRFRFANDPPAPRPEEIQASLKQHPVVVENIKTLSLPKQDTIDLFRAAALKLLERYQASRETPSAPTSTTSINGKHAWFQFAQALNEATSESIGYVADVLIGATNVDYPDKLVYLSTPDPEARLILATELVTKQTSIAEVSSKISTAVSESLSKQQKEFFLRQQLSAIQKELASLHSSSRDTGKAKTSGGQSGDGDLDEDDQGEIDDLVEVKRKIETMVNGSEEKKMGSREYRRLKRIPQGSVEQGVLRTYLEWLTSLPWPSSVQSQEEKEQQAAMLDPQFLANARAQLDADHFGLEKIKKRLVEYLAIVRLKYMNSLREASEQSVQPEKVASSPPTATPTPSPASSTPTSSPSSRTTNRAPILLFVGPPGVGKTSLGQSIAKALHRPFQRISLGGVRDEAEIRGHRRTYVASGPGAIVQALRKAGRRDPVLLLDEIDKVSGSTLQGDPSAALLEVLDPEQNWSFKDHYVDVPLDLSGVLFVCTANSLEGISGPLLDRCEVIGLSGYTYDEKMRIARKFLLPKQMTANGMNAGGPGSRGQNVELTDDALEWIATRYTREAGVRNLERLIGAVVRAKAVQWAEWMDKKQQKKEGGASQSSGPREWNSVVRKEDLENILGPPRWDGEEKDREERRGVVWGLVVMGMGEGAIMPVESIAVPGSGKLKLTGSLGEVIKESGELALSWVKTHAYALHVTNKPSDDPLKLPDPIDVHLHLPAGAQRKDGPSAGVAMVCAFVSLLTGAMVPTDIAMTGEITLRGRVTPVGGIKEKVLGAHRAKIKKVILPLANKQDVDQDVPKEIKDRMNFAFVRTLEEALREAFGSQLDWRASTLVVDSRL